LVEYQTGYASLLGEGADILGVGLDTEQAVRDMADEAGLAYPMLYDPASTIAAAYGVRDFLAGDYTTVTFVVDDDLVPIMDPVGTRDGERLPAAVVLQAIQQSRDAASTRA
jgi:peroxiredoxin